MTTDQSDARPARRRRPPPTYQEHVGRERVRRTQADYERAAREQVSRERGDQPPQRQPDTVKEAVGRLKLYSGPAPIIPILMIGIGGYLAWFAVKYWRGEGPAVWPSYPVKSVLQGKGLPPRTAAATSSATLTSWESQAGTSAGTGGGYPGAPKGQAQNTARMLLSRYGWGADQLGPLISLWRRESGWSNSAWNPSGAYGIAQALGHAGPGECATGPRSVGSATPGVNCAYGSQYGLTPAQAKQANAGNLLQQIRWGLGYIKDRYGNPAGAWRHEQAAGWY